MTVTMLKICKNRTSEESSISTRKFQKIKQTKARGGGADLSLTKTINVSSSSGGGGGGGGRSSSNILEWGKSASHY